MDYPIVVIGAGVGGLSAAIYLASKGRRVVVLERNSWVGGKMAEVREGGFRWDMGPSLITMRPVMEDLFTSVGREMNSYLNLQPLEPITRCFYPDGVVLDLSRDSTKMLEQLRYFVPSEVEGYLDFLNYAARLYRITGPVFIFDQPPRMSSLSKVPVRDVLRFDGLRTMSQAINTYVHSPHLRQVLGMFATYVGSSPYLAPAALNVIAHIELNQGVWYPQGGVYRIAEALHRLAEESGVEVRLGQAVHSILLEGNAVSGVALSTGESLPAAAVIANGDVFSVYDNLLPRTSRVLRRLRIWRKAELSSSALVMLLGVRGEHPDLAHHNEFFSSDYPREFHQIFRQGIPPSEPTIYVSITCKTTPEDAPAGKENWFVQVNAPALNQAWDWNEHATRYVERVLDIIAERGFDIRNRIEYCKILTPHDWEHMTGARRGALYGFSSNSRWAAFRRPHNRSPDVHGLYFAGGTTHPGGGVPMAMLSGKVASQLVIADGV